MSTEEVSVIYQTQTELAVCVWEDDEGEDIWLPISQIEIEPEDPERGDAVKVTAPETADPEKP